VPGFVDRAQPQVAEGMTLVVGEHEVLGLEHRGVVRERDGRTSILPRRHASPRPPGGGPSALVAVREHPVRTTVALLPLKRRFVIVGGSSMMTALERMPWHARRTTLSPRRRRSDFSIRTSGGFLVVPGRAIVQEYRQASRRPWPGCRHVVR